MQDLLAAAERGHLDVEGCPIAWARWTPAQPAPPAPPAQPAQPAQPTQRAQPAHPRRPIVLVHGAGAHIGWWEAVIGPLTTAGHTVVALELSGHGDSGHRDAYGARLWAREVLAVIHDVAGGPALLAGHSLGGRVAICAAAADPALVPRLVLVDAPVRRPGAVRPRVLPARPGPRRVHPTLEEAVRTFRLRPREPVADEALLGRVAAAAFAEHEGEGGWSLRVDLSVFGRIPDELIADALARYPHPLTLIYGTRSTVVDGAGRDFLVEAHAGPTELVEIEGHHHLTLDQGAEVAAVIVERWALL